MYILIKNIILLIFFIIQLSVGGSLYSQVNWTKYEHNPLQNAGYIIYDEGIYKAWYLSANSSLINYSTSPDGIFWNKHDDSVFTKGEEGSWDSSEISIGCILHLNGEYKMWYNGEDGENSRIGYATSPDGITWEKYSGNPILDLGETGTWDGEEIFHPHVLYDGITYHMWYNGYGQYQQRTGYATSTDGVTWEKYPSNPVISTGDEGNWDDYMLVLMGIIYKDDIFHMWYTAGDGTDDDKGYFRVGYATSNNGINWIKYEHNPVLDIGEEGSWESIGVITNCVIYDNILNMYKMWYIGFDGELFRIGYATAPADVSFGIENTPFSFTLRENYPNPFNPTTTISYSIPGSSHVIFSVYNTLDHKVRTFDLGIRTAGNHKLLFDCSMLPSGVYLYRIRAGNRAKTGRMLLMK